MHARILLVLALSAGCVSTKTLQLDHAETERILTKIDRNKALDCAPELFASAEAHEEFARLEFKQGDARLAQLHVQQALSDARQLSTDLQTCTPKDSDGDGISDRFDSCPSRAEDFDGVEDDDGCPERDVTLPGDSDGDGIVDDADQCPSEPEDLDAFKDADGCPDPDNDRDGVMDPLDQCPNRLGMTDDGCPSDDYDRDGVVDSMDRCPAENETANGYADQDGCPDQAPPFVRLMDGQILMDDPMMFEGDSAVLMVDSHVILDSVVQVLRDHPDMTLRVEGHTDNQGGEQELKQRAEQRAQAVADYIQSMSIDAARLTVEGVGMDRPVDTNRTPSGREANNRIEIHVTSGEAGAPAEE